MAGALVKPAITRKGGVSRGNLRAQPKVGGGAKVGEGGHIHWSATVWRAAETAVVPSNLTSELP